MFYYHLNGGKKMKRIMYLLIITLMVGSFAGCQTNKKVENLVQPPASGESDESNEFYYEKAEVSPKGESDGSFATLENNAICYGDATGSSIIVNKGDGQTYRFETGYSEGIQRLGSNGKDKIIISLMGENDDKVVVYDTTGEILGEYSIELMRKFNDGQGNIYPAMDKRMFMNDRFIYFVGNNFRLTAFNIETGETNQVTEEQYMAFDIEGDKLYLLMAGEGMSVDVVNLEIGQVEESILLETEGFFMNIYKTDNGYMTIDFDSKVYVYDNQGKEKETMNLKAHGPRIFNGKVNVGSLHYDGNSLFVGIAGEINMATISDSVEGKAGESDAQIMKLTEVKGENPYTAGLSTLNIYMKNKNYIIEMMAEGFMKDHPDVDVKIINHDNVSNEDYVKKLNTELISGEAIDIVMFDQLPVRKLADKGFFADLGKLIQPEELENMYPNVLESIKYKGNLYGLPLTLKVNGLYLDKSYFDSYEGDIQKDMASLDGFAKALESFSEDEDGDGDGIDEKSPLRAMEKDEILKALLTGFSQELYDFDNSSKTLNDEKFIEILETVDQISQPEIMNAEMDYDNYVFNGTKGAIGADLLNNAGFEDIQFTNVIFDGDYKLLSLPNGKGAGASFNAEMMGVVSSTINTDIACEFVKYLCLDEKVQKSLMEFSKISADKRIIDYKKANNQYAGQVGLVYAKETKYGNREIGIKEPENTHLDELDRLLKNASTSTVWANEIIGLTVEEANKYFSGAMSREEMIESLNNKLFLYMNE